MRDGGLKQVGNYSQQTKFVSLQFSYLQQGLCGPQSLKYRLSNP